jgi:Ca2+-binding EF-hand superfamily protein
LKEKVSKDQHILTVIQKAFDKGQQGDIDTNSMIHWLKQELQSGYKMNNSEKAL